MSHSSRRQTISMRRFLATTAVIAVAHGGSQSAWAQSDEPSIQLVVAAGRPLRLALVRTVRVKGVGQTVAATLVEPICAYDRIVLPAGTKVNGHVEQIQPAPRRTRVRALLSGDLTPPRHVLLQFDTLILIDGRSIPIRTSGSPGTERVRLEVAGAAKTDGIAERARREAAREAKKAVSVVTAPGKLERLKHFALRSLPYHPDYLRAGTVYSATLLSSLDFGPAVPVERALEGRAPAPESILNARLVTPLDSANAQPGMRIEAVITQPVFSADHRLILPEGARLTGEVTFTRRARRFHRNGQLRFLFESVQAPDQNSKQLLASLYSVESSQNDRVAVDEEGGATIRSSKTRFAAPALAALAFAGTMHGKLDYDTDGAGPEMQYGGAGSGSLGGFMGLGVIGAAASLVSRPATVVIGVVGLARTTYTSVFGKGRDVSFPADTSIQVQLAPGPSKAKP